MSKIDDLLTHVSDTAVQRQLREAIDEIKARRQFGIVFEQHIPETVLLSGARPKKGALVTSRTSAWNGDWSVEKIGSTTASLRNLRTGEQRSSNVDELIVVKPFGEAIYPCLTPVGEVAKGGDRPWHAVINGENYHALQLLLYVYEGKTATLNDEMARPGFAGWLRNREKQPWALCVPYMHAGVWKGCYPDFLVFGRKGNDVIVDVIDPHLTSIEDAPFKAAALARFADDHQDQFGRIDLIIVDKAGTPDERVKRLKLMDQNTRKKVMAVSTPQHLRDLFDYES